MLAQSYLAPTMESTTLKISGIYGPIIGRCEKGPPKRLASTRPMAMPKVITMMSLVGTRASKMAISPSSSSFYG